MAVLRVKVRKGERNNKGVEDLLSVTDKRDIEPIWTQPEGRDTEKTLTHKHTHNTHSLRYTSDSLLLLQRGRGHPKQWVSWKTTRSTRRLRPECSSILCAMGLLRWRKKNRKEKSLKSKTIKKKPQTDKVKEKAGAAGEVVGGSVRHTNPYLKRWRLKELTQQS